MYCSYFSSGLSWFFHLGFHLFVVYGNICTGEKVAMHSCLYSCSIKINAPGVMHGNTLALFGSFGSVVIGYSLHVLILILYYLVVEHEGEKFF